MPLSPEWPARPTACHSSGCSGPPELSIFVLVTTADEIVIRPARPADMPAVAGIWHAGWPDGHLGHVPDELVVVRTANSFRTRAAERAADTRVAEVDGAIAGFTMIVEDEVEQVYVAAAHRGTGVADNLLADAERRIRMGGHRRAWLAVVAGNARARRFYERRGWVDDGPMVYAADGPSGPIDVPAQRYVKNLA
jgi:GNAT superfamily N-acetyltransferase